jgi:hypothetical protein
MYELESKWVNEWENESGSDEMREWIGDWMKYWENEWEREIVKEWTSKIANQVLLRYDWGINHNLNVHDGEPGTSRLWLWV